MISQIFCALGPQKGNEKEETNAASSMPSIIQKKSMGMLERKDPFLYRKALFFLVRSVEQGWMRSERRRKEAFFFLTRSSKEELLVLLMVAVQSGEDRDWPLVGN